MTLNRLLDYEMHMHTYICTHTDARLLLLRRYHMQPLCPSLNSFASQLCAVSSLVPRGTQRKSIESNITHAHTYTTLICLFDFSMSDGNRDFSTAKYMYITT